MRKFALAGMTANNKLESMCKEVIAADLNTPFQSRQVAESDRVQVISNMLVIMVTMATPGYH